MRYLDRISVVIPVLNEEQNLLKCLGSLADFKNIVVVDSGLNFNTKKICEERDMPVVDFNWNGAFPKKRNWFLENVPLNTDCVFFLDADKFYTSDFVDELLNSSIPTVKRVTGFPTIITLRREVCVSGCSSVSWLYSDEIFGTIGLT